MTKATLLNILILTTLPLLPVASITTFAQTTPINGEDNKISDLIKVEGDYEGKAQISLEGVATGGSIQDSSICVDGNKLPEMESGSKVFEVEPGVREVGLVGATISVDCSRTYNINVPSKVESDAGTPMVLQPNTRYAIDLNQTDSVERSSNAITSDNESVSEQNETNVVLKLIQYLQSLI